MSKSADAFRTISEVAEWLGVQTHVLRFWESKFAQVKPVKRAGGRRYYRPSDMLLLGGIRRLLHEDGLTIKGVQKILREEGIAHVADMSHPLDDYTSAQLDADLADHTGADVSDALESTPAPSDLDHAPEHSRPAPPTPPADDDAVDAAEGLPSFMRTSAPDAAPDAPMAAQTEDAPETGIDSPDMGDMDAPIQFSDMAPDLTPELASDLPSDFVSDFFSESPSETALDTSPEINADPGAFDDTPAEDVPSPAPDAPEDPTPPQSIPETMFEDFAPKPAEDNSTQERPEVAQVPEVFDTAAQTPISFDFDAPVEDTPPVPEPDDIVPEPALMDAPAAEKPDAPEPVQDAPAPMFSRAATPAVEPDLDTAPLAAPPSEVEPEAEPIFDAPPIAPEPEATAQPEPEPETAQFAPEPEAAAEPEAAPLPEIDAAPPAPEPEPEPAAPPPLRPRIIDVPDDDGLNSADFAPSVLTKAAKLRQLTPAQRDQMRPLIAQLTALRDQMAQARHEQR